jgi:hypothetical protein
LDIITSYCAGRKEMAVQMLAACQHPLTLEVLRRTLWSPACCQEDGVPQHFFPSVKWKQRLEVVGFQLLPLRVENIQGKFLRTQVSSNWYLDLTPYRQGNEFLDSLSKKAKKNLHWLCNVYPREKFSFVPIRTPDDLTTFLEIYLTQRPGSVWGKELREPLFRIYQELESMGKNRSFLLKDRDGQPVAAALGYEMDQSFNLHMLTRKPGLYDKFSPLFFFTFWLIQHVLADTEIPVFLFGPGEFEYKKRFLGQELPIYRYEQLSWKNFFGVLKLYRRYWKEKKKAQNQDISQSNGEI